MFKACFSSLDSGGGKTYFPQNKKKKIIPYVYDFCKTQHMCDPLCIYLVNRLNLFMLNIFTFQQCYFAFQSTITAIFYIDLIFSCYFNDFLSEKIFHIYVCLISINFLTQTRRKKIYRRRKHIMFV